MCQLIKNLGVTVSTPFVFLNCKMSKMHVNHLRVTVDLEKILQCEDIGSEYCVELKALQNLEYLDIFTRG